MQMPVNYNLKTARETLVSHIRQLPNSITDLWTAKSSSYSIKPRLCTTKKILPIGNNFETPWQVFTLPLTRQVQYF